MSAISCWRTKNLLPLNPCNVMIAVSETIFSSGYSRSRELELIMKMTRRSSDTHEPAAWICQYALQSIGQEKVCWNRILRQMRIKQHYVWHWIHRRDIARAFPSSKKTAWQGQERVGAARIKAGIRHEPTKKKVNHIFPPGKMHHRIHNRMIWWEKK